MKLEPRFNGLTREPRAIVLIAESKQESKYLDAIFGSKVGAAGLIGTSTVECRLSSGFDQHYLLIERNKDE